MINRIERLTDHPVDNLGVEPSTSRVSSERSPVELVVLKSRGDTFQPYLRPNQLHGLIGIFHTDYARWWTRTTGLHLVRMTV